MERFWLCRGCLLAVAYDDISALSLYYSETEVDQRIALMRTQLQDLLSLSADFDPHTGAGIQAFSTTVRGLPQPAARCASSFYRPVIQLSHLRGALLQGALHLVQGNCP
ncbi:hypothetical protein ACIPZ8_14935 [Pseudomonas sp. NPDC089422]|uniref:hypothetical protein n=1 Tax=Pseudomonas sp. NPDC089422 TaxID=3364466 RepID=UPI003829D56D